MTEMQAAIGRIQLRRMSEWHMARKKNAQAIFTGSCSEVYREKTFDDTSFRPENRLQVARELEDTSLMFLVHPSLTQLEIDKTSTAIQDVFSLL